MGLDHDDEIAADVALENAAGHTGRAAHASNVGEDSEHEFDNEKWMVGLLIVECDAENIKQHEKSQNAKDALQPGQPLPPNNLDDRAHTQEVKDEFEHERLFDLGVALAEEWENFMSFDANSDAGVDLGEFGDII